MTVPSKDLAAAKAIKRAATHRISWNFIFLSKNKNDFTRFMCLVRKRDQKYEHRIEEKDEIKILQRMSETKAR